MLCGAALGDGGGLRGAGPSAPAVWALCRLDSNSSRCTRVTPRSRSLFQWVTSLARATICRWGSARARAWRFAGTTGIVHSHHQDARVFGPGDAQQVQACGVAVEHAVAEGARYLQHVHAVVQHGGGDALGQQHARDDLPVAAEARDDDGRLLGLGDFLGLGLGGLELGT